MTRKDGATIQDFQGVPGFNIPSMAALRVVSGDVEPRPGGLLRPHLVWIVFTALAIGIGFLGGWRSTFKLRFVFRRQIEQSSFRENVRSGRHKPATVEYFF
jgi:hypothetical protein